VTFRSPEEELKEFLAQYPQWMEDILWKSPSPDNLRPFPRVVEQYESILKRIPGKWREYCEARRKYLKRELLSLAGRAGRPRKDALAEEAQQLRSEGKSYAKVAKALNLRHGEGTLTADAVRKLLISRKRGHPPEKI
jgi:hypothetical protein